MGETRRPIHLGIAVGVSASLYAVSLAAVTGLQSGQNAQTSSAYAPLVSSVDQVDGANADLAARLDAARAAFDASAGSFSDVVAKVPGFETRLKALAGAVTKIRGTSVSMPTGGALPRVSGAGTVAKPPVHVTTSASGH
jgi:hypothetical protein